MVILVTGGSGFIGSHLVDKLKEKGYDVRVFDLNPPLRSDVEWFKGDLLNNDDVLKACKDVEVVFHLAAIADVYVAITHPDKTLLINEVGTLNLLRAAIAREVERVILASTIWVYGGTTGIVTEETPIPPPDHIYTKTKIGQEHLVQAWNAHYGLPYTILRYGIPYGPRMRKNMAIAIFVRKAMHKEPITIYGDGNQGRCFIYVEDLVEGNIAAMQLAGKNQIFNIAGEEFITMNQIVRELKKVFGEFPVEYAPPRPGDYRGNIISIEKAKNLLNWAPKIKFAEGLRRYIRHMKSETEG